MARFRNKLITPAERRRLRRDIEAYEAGTNGLYMSPGSFVSAKRIQINDHTATATIIISSGQGRAIKKYENCQYPLAMFRKG